MRNLSCENEFHWRENEKALNLVLIQRLGGTRKWLIVQFRRLGLLIKNLTHMSDLQMLPFPLLDRVVVSSATHLCIKCVRSADQPVSVSLL